VAIGAAAADRLVEENTYLHEENESLQAAVASLQEELASARAQLMQKKESDDRVTLPFQPNESRLYVCVAKRSVGYRASPNMDAHLHGYALNRTINRYNVAAAVGTHTDSAGIKWIKLGGEGGEEGDAAAGHRWLPTTPSPKPYAYPGH
jgi:hypothetical protein